MTVNQLMFIYAVEEMSFSKAAERAFVTQQCLSNHVHRLEKSYGVALFERSNNRLILTEAGRILYKSLVQIRDLEASAREQMLSSNSDVQGTVRFGTHQNRSRLFVPQIYSKYTKKYPSVDLKVSFVHTAGMLKLLSDNMLDVCLAVNDIATPGYNFRLIGEENVVILARQSLLEKCIPGWEPSRTAITAEEMSKIPFTGFSGLSIIKQTVEQFINLAGYRLSYNLQVDGYVTQFVLCSQGLAAMYCPEHQLFGEPFTTYESDVDPIRVLLLKDYSNLIPVHLISSEARNLPSYITDFSDMLSDIYAEQLNSVREKYSIFPDLSFPAY